MVLKDKFLRIILWFSKKTVPLDLFAKRYPISVKGIIIEEGKILLLKNERNEWDLPGGKFNNDFSVEDCLIREVKEETNLDIIVENLLTVFVYNIQNWIDVFVLVYQCQLKNTLVEVKISGEHFDYCFFSVNQLKSLNIGQKYRKIIENALSK